MSSPAGATPMCSGRTTTAADRKSKSSTRIDLEGRTRAAFQVTGPRFHDWEDIAIDDAGHLYLGDIGNNESREDKLAVYEIDEPDPTSGTGSVSPKRGWTLKFPGAPFDCESLFIWKNHGYVISKVYDNARAQIFRFPLEETNEPLTLELVATTKIESPVTGADISVDGNCLVSFRKPAPTSFGSTATWRGSPRRATSHQAKGPAHRRLLLCA